VRVKPIATPVTPKALRSGPISATIAVGQTGASDRRRSGALDLIAAYETDPRQWGKMQRIDQYSGKRHKITASGAHGPRTLARVKSYSDVLREYEFHPEAKSTDSSGAPCSKRTIRLLGRWHITIDSITYIGKESNRLEEVEEQSLLDPSDVYTEYPDPRRNEWATKILPRIKTMPLRELMERTGLPRSTLQAIRAGRRPHSRALNQLKYVACRISRIAEHFRAVPTP
jgi:hypothetical protein